MSCGSVYDYTASSQYAYFLPLFLDATVYTTRDRSRRSASIRNNNHCRRKVDTYTDHHHRPLNLVRFYIHNTTTRNIFLIYIGSSVYQEDPPRKNVQNRCRVDIDKIYTPVVAPRTYIYYTQKKKKSINPILTSSHKGKRIAALNFSEKSTPTYAVQLRKQCAHNHQHNELTRAHIISYRYVSIYT